MSLNIKALAMTGALLFSACLLLVGLINMAVPQYGGAFLNLANSIYPGYDGPTGFGSVIVVTLYGAVDGAVCGALVAWLYNAFAGSPKPTV